MSEITVAIATRNRPEALRRCIRAIVEGTSPPAEIIVVDQGDERTDEIISALRDRFAPIVHVRMPPNKSAALNAAVRKASTGLVAITDDDCVPAANWLEEISRLAAGNPDVLTGRILALGDSAPGRHPVSLRTSTERREFSRRTPPWIMGSGNNLAVRRSTFLKLGGFDRRLGPGSAAMAAEDMDFLYRCSRMGARIAYEPALLVFHAQTTTEGRRRRRMPYGFGMGAACVFWLRQRDPYAAVILMRWFALRLSRLADGLRAHDAIPGEELLVLRGTMLGIIYGVCAGHVGEKPHPKGVRRG